ncbi:peptide/nickel transport system substrate-binding protein [Evansella caseinilytica]|uniref:Peptide/nickel transport system substrate-binding protein n=1 Tax=Evansella caseinilytica TaxID=1503961 RepID=A0A1H3UJM9_9BACI|nr:oligopeptide ABC transporter substrate-binding protein [Evansella caseinilytica]SDZ62547.1 peptide/nickel transport system substrate-binding protein [Evansella caseinilytica]
MTKAMKGVLTAMLILLLTLAACSSDDSATTDDEVDDSGQDAENAGDDEEEEAEDDGLFSIDDFSNMKASEGDALEGGTITFGLVSDTAFEGTLNYNFYSGNPDAQILQWFDESFLTWDENYVYTQDGAATYETSEDGSVFTFTIRDNVNWHDGEPVTAEDWLFAHEVIGHPDYDGPRYGSDFTNIVGMDEYHNGEADTISGITILNDKQLQIEFINVTPSLVTGSIWTYPLAKHIFGDMEVADMSSSPEVREHPTGFGPFKVETIVPGESVTYVKNEDYWRGEPNLDGVILKVVNPNTVVQELQTGGVDLVSSFPVDQFPDNAEMSNVEWLGIVDRAYTYIGFKLGSWDGEKGEVVPDPDKKVADVNLRKAMWHAVDNTAVAERFYHGLRWNATTLIPPSHPEFHDETNPGITFDPEQAKQILDEAGYEDVTGDGFRETPEGEELVINFASMTGGDIAEPLARYYVQSWNNIGLNVELDMLEFNTFYDRVGQNGDDDPTLDVYMGAWSVGIDVDPTGLYGRNALFNFPRYASEENDRLLAEGVSEAAFDLEYRKEIYQQWQQLMVEEIPVFPTLYRSEVVPVNNRVQNYAIGDGTGVYLYELAVTSDQPLVAE